MGLWIREGQTTRLLKEDGMDGKQVTESSVVMAQMMIPQDANPAGNIHGGVVVKIIDEAAGVVAPGIPAGTW